VSDIDKKPKALRRAQDLTTTDRARMIRDLEFGSALGAETVAQLAESSRVIDVRRRRFVYRAVGGRASHHNAFFQVFPTPDAKSKVLWVTDLLPDEMRAPIEQMVELGSGAIQRTLEESYRAVE